MKETGIPTAQDLRRDGEEAAERKIPVLLYFSQSHCSYCRRMEEEILLPIMRSGQYDTRMLLREVIIDEEHRLTGFDGRALGSRMLFHEYDGIVTPTLVLTDGAGRTLGKPLIGINTVELFGWYLDSAIDGATQQMRKPRP